MNKRIVSFALVASYLLLCLLSVQPVKSQAESPGFIFIRPDGSVEPSSAPIQQMGDVFTFTANIHDPIVIERNHIVLDGAGLYLQGNRTSSAVGRDNGVGINVTSSNVTIMNIHILNWTAGILGAYNNNTIISNFITNCDKGIKIYGDNYTIDRNYIANNYEGIRLFANSTVVSQNKLIDNDQGINIAYYNHLILENNLSNVNYDIAGGGMGGVLIYRNNFFKTNPNGYVLLGDMAVWDNGKEGNFWKSGYKGKDINGDGIGDEPYNIGQIFTNPANGSRIWGVDNYPLMKPVIIQEFPQPSPVPSPTPPPSPSPSPTPTPTPTAPLTTPATTPTSTPPPSLLPTIPENKPPTASSFPTEIVVVVVIIVAIAIVALVLVKRLPNQPKN